ncbi:MAG: hypothetical protein HQM08_07975 [Candidatus Riflebacteria bacterium]|nr:hypothetical protein [Candidatus Riflebacteria bacterium]
MRKLILGLLIFIIGFGTQLSAIPYNAGTYVVDVEIYNRNSLLIPDGYAKVHLKGNVITGKVEAPGYETSEFEIAVDGGQTYFKRIVVLNDIPKQIDVYTFIGEPVKSAYVDNRQYGFTAKDYGLSVFIPQKAWPNPCPQNIKVIDELFGTPINYTCEIASQTDEFICVKMAIPRDAIMMCGKRIFVMINDEGGHNAVDGNEIDSAIKLNVDRLKNTENSNNPLTRTLSEDFAQFIFNATSAEKLIDYSKKYGPLPDSLSKKIETSEKFRLLHGEK